MTKRIKKNLIVGGIVALTMVALIGIGMIAGIGRSVQADSFEVPEAGDMELTASQWELLMKIVISNIEDIDANVDAILGGLVHQSQEYFVAGMVLGVKDIGQTGVQQILLDSSNNLYIGTSTDAVFKIAAGGGITLRDVTMATSSFNWSADLSVDTDTLHIDSANDRIGSGTTTPSYDIELEKTTTSTIAITASGALVNDAVLRFNKGYQGATSIWKMFLDDSDSDGFKIATSSPETASSTDDLITIDYSSGDVTIAKAATITGAAALSSTLTVTGETNLDTLVQGGDVTSIATASTTLTAAQLCDSSVIQFHLPNDGDAAGTIYLATSTEIIADCLTSIGDTITLLFINNATNTNDILIDTPLNSPVGNGYIDLLEPSGGDVIIQRTESAWISITNIDNTTSTISITSLQVAD